MTTTRIALITGANQGLGLALAKGLAARWTPADRVLLTGRDPERVRRAAADAASNGGAVVEGRLLDVTDPAAITATAAALRDEFGGVDVVLSNATARSTPADDPAAVVDENVATSNLAATRILRAFAPELRPGGRLIVVASSLGTLEHVGEAVRPAIDAARTLDEVDALTETWRAAVHAGTAEADGWTAWLNYPSKVLQVAAVRALAVERREADLAAGTLVASVCPGLLDTDASRPWFEDMSDAATPDEGAAPILDLVEAPLVPAQYGELVRFGEVLPWHGATDPASVHHVVTRR